MTVGSLRWGLWWTKRGENKQRGETGKVECLFLYIHVFLLLQSHGKKRKKVRRRERIPFVVFRWRSTELRKTVELGAGRGSHLKKQQEMNAGQCDEGRRRRKSGSTLKLVCTSCSLAPPKKKRSFKKRRRRKKKNFHLRFQRTPGSSSSSVPLRPSDPTNVSLLFFPVLGFIYLFVQLTAANSDISCTVGIGIFERWMPSQSLGTLRTM